MNCAKVRKIARLPEVIRAWHVPASSSFRSSATGSGRQSCAECPDCGGRGVIEERGPERSGLTRRATRSGKTIGGPAQAARLARAEVYFGGNRDGRRGNRRSGSGRVRRSGRSGRRSCCSGALVDAPPKSPAVDDICVADGRRARVSCVVCGWRLALWRNRRSTGRPIYALTASPDTSACRPDRPAPLRATAKLTVFGW